MIPAKSSNYDLPDSYDNIEQTLITADQILSDAVENAKTLFHSPTVSSFEHSKIVSRVMVLREFNLKERFMRFHTDYRDPKIKQYKKNSTATVLVYDPILKVQINCKGKLNLIIITLLRETLGMDQQLGLKSVIQFGEAPLLR